MRWLHAPENESERVIRAGLDEAAQRTGDEITHRRVWAKVADAVLLPESRPVFRLVLAGSALAAVFCVGVFAYTHLGPRKDTGAQARAGNPSPASVSGQASAETPALPVASGTSLDPVTITEVERAPGHAVRTRQGERARVGLGGGAVAELDESSGITWDNQHRPSVESGTARLSVPHQPPGWRFSVTAGPYVVTVVGTKFDVRVADHTVGVTVSEGIVEVWRGSQSTRLVAGDSWNGPLFPEEAQPELMPAPLGPGERPAKVERPQSVSDKSAAKPEIRTDQAVYQAELALRAGDNARAVEILTRAARGTGPAAENAAYELGRVMRYNLKRPRQAVELWDKYRTRFPTGLLRTEADLSIVETLSQLGDVRSALDEADAFLARHPQSERRLEVARLAARLRAAQSGSDRE